MVRIMEALLDLGSLPAFLQVKGCSRAVRRAGVRRMRAAPDYATGLEGVRDHRHSGTDRFPTAVSPATVHPAVVPLPADRPLTLRAALETSRALVPSSVFPSSVIDRPGSRDIVITAPEADDTHMYVDAVLLDGRALRQSWLTLSGGRLDFRLTEQPDTEWATDPGTLPE